MSLPFKSSFEAMEALSADEIPVGSLWQYEPKWDGFRCLIFRDAKRIDLQSKAGQPLGRYFPEVLAAVGALGADRFLLDGEIVISMGEQLSFDDLLQRIHPAESRIRKLSTETPATLVVFDCLTDEHGHSLADRPLSERRRHLDAFAKKYLKKNVRIKLSPKTESLSDAKAWYEKMAGGLDGVVAKRLDAAYEPGQRSGAWQKIKNLRTAECVIGAFRYAEKPQAGKKVVGSLLLGLYNDDGKLDHVGFCSGIKDRERVSLTAKLEKLRGAPGFTGKAPGGPSRWSTKRSTEWEPLKSELVVEVQYDHFTGGRFRHGTQLLRWRPDKAPHQCKMSQIIHESRSPLTLLSAKSR